MMMDIKIAKKTLQHIDKNGYAYQTVEDDAYGVRMYTLKNGLEVYLAQNTDAPRIQTFIPVRTGSNNDPADNTGLSHYLEHMMFKGTSKIGSMDWEKEKVLLDKIEALFEKHKEEQKPEKKAEIYQQIDTLSQEASTYAIANEYDKLMSTIGATGTNAHTWLDETVYKNVIPNNELERWLKIEKERFSEIVLRLFHTELESVYEEFNRAQDNDARLVNYALMEALFPNHPNGQQTTLGKAEHLKNPSMKAIYKYFSDFYVPNNYALVLVGDLDFEETITLIDQYFGAFEYKELPKKTKVMEEPLTSIVERVIKSPTIPRVQIAWRTDSFGSRESMMVDIVANILSNKGEAGLIDININQKQTALFAQAYSMGFKQYGYFSAVIVPNETQTLEDGVALLLEQIENVKNGNFEDWLLSAIINDFKLQRQKTWDTAEGLATTLYDCYIKERSWEEELSEMDCYASITKEDVIDFAKNFFGENYVLIKKEQGVNESLIRVDNPGITPVKINRDAKSDFFAYIESLRPNGEIEPQFIDYNQEIKKIEVDGKKVNYVKNTRNDIAQFHLIFPFGTDHDKEIVLALNALQYFGTSQYSAESLRKEFYKIGITHDFYATSQQLTVTISGLEENISRGMQLLKHWLEDAQPDQEAYDAYVNTILESREAAKKDKTRIMTALINYAKYGENSRFRDILSEEQLQSIEALSLTEKANKLLKTQYEVFYFGKKLDVCLERLASFCVPATEEIPTPKIYNEPSTDGNVYFVDYDMVQMEMSKVGKGRTVNPSEFHLSHVFNEYFGRGLSSIVFQEMRESKSLAYSAYVMYQTNTMKEHSDYVTTYIGTQPDKLKIAVDTLDELMQELPNIPLQFEAAKNNVLKQIASARVMGVNIFFNALKLEKLGVYHDYRKDIYEGVQKMKFSDVDHYYQTHIQPLQYNTAIIGKRENLNKEAISQLGDFQEVTLEEIFGY